MLIIFLKHFLSLTTILRYFHEIQSSPGVDKLLHLSITFLNSSLEKDNQVEVCFDEISFKISGLICQS